MEQLDIIKYLNGQAGREESAKIEAWIAESKENKMTFHRWKSVWESASAIAPAEAPKVDDAWEKIRPTVENPAKVVPMYMRWQSIAAAAVILLGISFFGWRYFLSEPELLFASTQIGETKEVELPDGSVVWLDESTQLTYPETFKRNTRSVSLIGTAFFDVERMEQAPFVIDGHKSQVAVLGTSFVVHTHPDSVEVKVEVKTGKVALIEKGKSQESGLVLVAGEQGALNVTTGQLQKSSIENSNYLAWQNQMIEFAETPMKEVEKTLEKVYKTDLIIENPDFYNCLFTARFENEKLETILDSIAFLFGVEIVQEGRNFRIIAEEGC